VAAAHAGSFVHENLSSLKIILLILYVCSLIVDGRDECETEMFCVKTYQRSFLGLISIL